MPSSSPTHGNPLALLEEGARVMHICNACRYCEGFCAVFPAMERRLEFPHQDLRYLANLCHDCGECYYSCQYAPPHEFAVNVPKTLAAIRVESYRSYAWPRWFSGIFRRSGSLLILSALAAPLAFVLLLRVYAPAAMLSASPVAGGFYAVLPHEVMVAAFGTVGVLVLLALGGGLVKFWRETGEPFSTLVRPAVLMRVVSDAARLRYLDGGGGGSDGGVVEGCAYPTEVPSTARRWFHHLTFYGFLLCFAATAVAAIYHNFFGWIAPYSWTSLPVMLGCLGGIGLLAGPAGLLWLKGKRDAALSDRAQSAMDLPFLVLLLLIALTGFLLLLLRASAWMGLILAVHLGVVMGLFLAIPYGKFVHAIYRLAALARNAAEELHAHERK